MFLEKLEIFGFKSIPHKLSLRFGPGVTAIVGPNGCGKSNLSDAIRWVLGEQSARLLRGHSMEDVIFNGTAARKPLGMAEVFLTFSNTKNLLPVEYSTVAVGRRLYRSGQSDYVLNRKPCRLRDVRDLLLDTGIGSSGYSLIAREMVESVLAEDSGQRRQMLEEAAGITKYKARKHETMLKLAATEGDLVRVADIISEVDRETQALGRQVGRARRYRRSLERVQHLDLALSRHRVHDLAARRDELADRLAGTRVSLEGERVRMAKLDLVMEERRIKQTELERALRVAAEELDRHDRTLAEWSSEVRVLRERQLATDARLHQARDQVAKVNERLGQNASAGGAAAAELMRLAADGETMERDLAERETRRLTSERAWRDKRAALDQQKQLRLDLLEDHVERRSALTELRSRAEELASRRQRLAEDRDRAAEEMVAAESRRAAAASELDRARAAAEATRVEVGELEVRLTDLEQADDEAHGRLLKLTETAAAHESRLQVLLDLRRRYEGFARGVQTLLAGGRPEGIHGTAAEIMRVPAQFVEAVEAALGPGVGTIIVEDRESTTGFIDRLRASEGGRAVFLPLAGLRDGRRPALPAAAEPSRDRMNRGVLGRANQLVTAQSPRFQAVIDYLLGDVLITPDRASAMALAARPEAAGQRVVTLEGELWTAAGVISGGAGARGSVLGREQEIAATEAALIPLRTEIALARTEEAELGARREGTSAALRELRSRLEAEREIVLEHEKRKTEIELSIEVKKQGIRELDEAGAGLGVDLERLAGEEGTLGEALADARRENDSFESSWARLETEIAQLEEERDARLTEEQECRIAWTALSGRLAEARGEGERLAADRAELESEKLRLEAEIDAGATALASLAEAIVVHEAQIAEGVAGREGKETAVHELEISEGEARSEVAAEEKSARDARRDFDSLVERVHRDELDHERARGEIEATAARIREEYGVELLETHEILAEDETPEAAAEELAQLRDRLRRIGPVNLLAIEQYDEVRGRLEFLTKQRDDLVAARAELLEAIERINLTASELFQDTFAKVKENFGRVFSTLFDGGEAEITLQGDELDGGIEIMACPRGKALRSIRMMSGGERALTAISLLFSIYLVKPSPFCIMDEVDAPLDDANIDRFVKLLRQFQRDTQFIVITHNKRTMEAAERLYGVTMEEPGVSKLVSVRLEQGELTEGEELAGDFEAAAMAGPPPAEVMLDEPVGLEAAEPESAERESAERESAELESEELESAELEAPELQTAEP
jgi:chromosome segregation protein